MCASLVAYSAGYCVMVTVRSKLWSGSPFRCKVTVKVIGATSNLLAEKLLFI